MPAIFVSLRRTTSSTVGALALALVLFAGALWPLPSRAGDLKLRAAGAVIVAVDWQGPLSLPPRFRNHCRYDTSRRAWYCANHCGRDYQFYFCSQGSFGCCQRGYGYCDWKGHLRCAP